MTEDTRFCLVGGDGTVYPAAIICDEFRFGKSKDEGVRSLSDFARGVIKHGKTGRFVTPEGRNTIGLGSRRVVGYRLDQDIAAAIGVPSVG